MEKAKIVNLDNKVAGKSVPVEYTVIFNPPSLKIATSNTYADAKNPGGNMEKQQFIKNNNDVLTVDLFFDVTRPVYYTSQTKDDPAKNDPEKKKAEEKKPVKHTDVREVVNPILDLAKVPKDKKEPPRLKFVWGEFVFECVIISIDHNYDYFDSSGHALRATLNVKFRRYAPPKAGVASADTAKKKLGSQQTIKAGQDITCFCADPKDWRSVAEENELDQPNLVGSGAMVGQTLVCSVQASN